MAANSLLLAALLVVVVSLAPRSAEADKQLPLALVAGVVPCSAGSSINVATVPPFPRHISFSRPKLHATGNKSSAVPTPPSPAQHLQPCMDSFNVQSPLLPHLLPAHATAGLDACVLASLLSVRTYLLCVRRTGQCA
ncbi:uncharacterized protein LOC119314427 isoform X2 [Triticum dicoccoides]|uniref:uncharacterized protein LOC119314427 isoform X2 n=1 Tax=Triticum dicoccoides TaxID=85692 RepID=UPI00189178BE|nr:uncharacterized protein LOC119314427 isoform X2 [Triticum dicoccoides]